MPGRSLSRRAFAWFAGWLFAAAFYLLLIDITDLPELLVGAGVAVLAATGLELARERHVVGESIRPSWLARSARPLAKVPADVASVSVVAIQQLVRRRPARGAFRAVRFRTERDDAHSAGRRALAEAMGSLAPNTIIVGVDTERQVILAHQLRRTRGRDAIDPMELG